jgi:diguanylate cyclase
MTILVDIAFLLLAAGGGVAAASLIVWLRAGAAAGPLAEAEAHFARDTLAKLQDLTRRVAADVDQHAECVEEINAVLASDDNDDGAVVAAVSQLVEANRRMQRQLDTAEERLEAQAVQIESHAVEARTDPLTQVANRRALDDELQRCVADFQRRGTPTTVMLLDVDHFKRFNDTHGHQAGDDALRTVARAIQDVMNDVGLVARYGGEEFAVVLAGRDAAAATVWCERARQAIGATPVRFGGRELRVTASAGVAEIMPGDTDQEFIRRADEALYASKNAGRNCGHLHDGRTSRLIRYQEPTVSSPAAAPLAADKFGDEWLYEADVATEVLFRESLPNVASRPAFFDDLIRRIAQWRRGGTPLTLLLIQVDAYPRIVSDHGPSCAEVVLRIASQLINASMRDMDHTARLSEDTFAVVLPGALLSDGLTIAERLRQAVERCKLPRKAGVNWFTISAGVVQANEGDDMRRVLQRGRAALTQAVNQGRNCVAGREWLGAPPASAADTAVFSVRQ